MQIAEEIVERLFNEMKKDFLADKILVSEKPQTFDNIELAILNFRERFTNKLTKVIVENEQVKIKKQCPKCGCYRNDRLHCRAFCSRDVHPLRVSSCSYLHNLFYRDTNLFVRYKYFEDIWDAFWDNLNHADYFNSNNPLAA